MQYKLRLHSTQSPIIATSRKQHIRQNGRSTKAAKLCNPCRMVPPTCACGSSKRSSPPGSAPQTTSSKCGPCGSTSISRTRGVVGPSPRLGTHAHRPADRAPACTKRRGPGTSRDAAEGRRPQHPAVQWAGGLEKAGRPWGGDATSGRWWSGMLQGRRGRTRDTRDAAPPALSPW